MCNALRCRCRETEQQLSDVALAVLRGSQTLGPSQQNSAKGWPTPAESHSKSPLVPSRISLQWVSDVSWAPAAPLGYFFGSLFDRSKLLAGLFGSSGVLFLAFSGWAQVARTFYMCAQLLYNFVVTFCAFRQHYGIPRPSWRAVSDLA